MLEPCNILFTSSSSCTPGEKMGPKTVDGTLKKINKNSPNKNQVMCLHGMMVRDGKSQGQKVGRRARGTAAQGRVTVRGWFVYTSVPPHGLIWELCYFPCSAPAPADDMSPGELTWQRRESMGIKYRSDEGKLQGFTIS